MTNKRYNITLYKHIKSDGSVSFHKSDMTIDLVTGLPSTFNIRFYGICVGAVEGVFEQQGEEKSLEDALAGIKEKQSSAAQEKYAQLIAQAELDVDVILNTYLDVEEKV